MGIRSQGWELPQKLQAWLSKNGARVVEFVAFTTLTLLFIQRWLYRFYLTPDSTFYLTAAKNFVEHGKMFVYTNWPSWTMEPGTELYADYAPGFPIYLIPFVWLIRDSLLAAAVAQTLAIVALSTIVYRTMMLLKIQPLLRLSALFFLFFFVPHRDPLQALLTEALFISLCFCVFWFCYRLVEYGESKRDWAIALTLLFCASGVRWNGFACVAFFVFPLLRYRKQVLLKSSIIVAAGILPIGLWFLRNYYQLDRVSTFYSRPRLMWDKISVPFQATVQHWGGGSILLTLAIFTMLLVPLFARHWTSGRNLLAYRMLLLGSLIQFLVIYGLSLVTFGMTPVDDRYLMPTNFLFTVALFFSLSCLFTHYKLERLSLAVVGLVALLFIPMAISRLSADRLAWFGTWTRPVEEQLWQELREKPYVARASHFNSDENYRHQVFAGIPQRMVRNYVVEQYPERILELWSKGHSPFFVVTPGSRLEEVFAKEVAPRTENLQQEKIAGFTVYYRTPAPGSHQ